MKVNEIVTNKIIEELEKGLIPWHKPWSGQGKCINYVSRKSYSILNEMLLGEPGEYLTFNQVKELGGSIKKGSISKMVVFYKPLAIKDETTEKEKLIPYLRYYNVFHINQCEDIESKIQNDVKKEFNSIEEAEKITNEYYKRENITFENLAQDKAYYSPSFDKIVMPLKKQFACEEEYYNVLFHETIHSTGHTTRLNRITKVKFRSEEYSKEELVAEIGASILMNQLKIDIDKTFKNSVAYIQSWLSALKNDKNMIISASSKAQKAVEYINEN